MVRRRIHFNGDGKDTGRLRRKEKNTAGFSQRRIRRKILDHIIQKGRLRIRKPQKRSRSGNFHWPLLGYSRVKDGSKGLKDDDLVIALLGPTGSGKSTFICSVSGSEAPHVSDALGSCTNEIVPTRVWDPESGRNVVLLDTPGFNNTFQTDHNLDILIKIFRWLRYSYKKGKHLSKILYFHRITDNRTPGTLLLYIRMFRKLLGEDRLESIHIITTMWDLVETSIGEERLRELHENDWKAIIGQGAHIARCRGVKSAKKIIRQIIDNVETRKDDLEMNDIVIAVIGATGSGKSTFVRAASGSETPRVSDTLRSTSTNEVVAVKCTGKEQQNGRCVILLDTPGFGSSDFKPKTEWDVLKMISEWLHSSHTKCLSGMLYLHRITDNRMPGTLLETHPALLRRLLGSDTLDKVYITTTMWDEVQEGVGGPRLKELKSTYWKKMIDQGAKICCIGADNPPKDVLRELLYERAVFLDSSAGK
ncbi:P-loop containing nucleoside triphosphate hydrolase protein [Chiua virens]|nr:P-loop containing nucleoside triphosphate hydrolase protein [Chiua virens]